MLGTSVLCSFVFKPIIAADRGANTAGMLGFSYANLLYSDPGKVWVWQNNKAKYPTFKIKGYQIRILICLEMSYLN